MSFHSYWDLSERERAELTREDVTKFLDAELMTKGVLKIAPPVPEQVGAPNVKPRDYYAVEAKTSSWDKTRVLFECADDAEQFLKLSALIRAAEYMDGESIEYAAPFDKGIKRVSMLSEADFHAHRSALQASAKAKVTNVARRQEYESACKAQEQALSGLWDDWAECRKKAHEFGQVRSTFEQYTMMAGDGALAAKFLAKVFPQDKIAAANEWFGLSIPTIDGDKPEPQPETVDGIAF